MSTLEKMIDLVTDDVLAWSLFLAIPVILFCIACLMPRGKGKLLLNIERGVMIAGVVAVLVAPIIVNVITPIGYNPVDEMLKDNAALTLALGALVIALLLGAFIGDSYIMQGIYGMLATILLPYGIIKVMFPIWAADATVSGIFTSALGIFTILRYAALIFIPLWLIRMGEYKMRLSSIWHLLGGLSLGGCIALFADRAGLILSPSVTRLFDFIKYATELDADALANLNVDVPELQIVTELLILIGFAIVVNVALAVIITLGRMIFKSETRNFVSESFLGLVIRTLGVLVAVGACAVVAGLMPMILGANGAFIIYIIPVVAYLLILLVAAFLADTVEIKRGIKLAKAELAAAAAPAAPVAEEESAYETAEYASAEEAPVEEATEEATAEEAPVEEATEEATEEEVSPETPEELA